MDYPRLLKILSKSRAANQDKGLLIILGGIHGSGKTTLSSMLQRDLDGLKVAQASELLNHTSLNKDVKSIESNQDILAERILEIKKQSQFLLVAGHFTLIDDEGNPKYVGDKIFEKISPDMLILMMPDPGIVRDRRIERDGMQLPLSEITYHNELERETALRVAEKLNIDILILNEVNGSA